MRNQSSDSDSSLMARCYQGMQVLLYMLFFALATARTRDRALLLTTPSRSLQQTTCVTRCGTSGQNCGITTGCTCASCATYCQSKGKCGGSNGTGSITGPTGKGDTATNSATKAMHGELSVYQILKDSRDRDGRGCAGAVLSYVHGGRLSCI